MFILFFFSFKACEDHLPMVSRLCLEFISLVLAASTAEFGPSRNQAPHSELENLGLLCW